MLFAVCAPGLEPVLLAEVQALGLPGRAIGGGVEVDSDDAPRLNLWLRTATRVLARLGSVKATAFPELVRKAAELPWERFVRRGAAVAFRVTCRKSRLYHSDAVAERLLSALRESVGDVALHEDGQLFIARFDRDVCTVSADSSGALLHQRGYRGPAAKAPLRETLAAALLLAARWDGSQPLCDPLCGSGTIAIEAALLAMRRAPGLSRSFAFEKWPGFDLRPLQDLRAAARAQERPLAAPIEASDQDAGAVAAARENAASAGVSLSIVQRQLASLPPDGGEGLVACNPPYGVRLQSPVDLHEALRKRPRWRAAVIAPRGAVSGSLLLKTENGGIPVEFRLVRG